MDQEEYLTLDSWLPRACFFPIITFKLLKQERKQYVLSQLKIVKDVTK